MDASENSDEKTSSMLFSSVVASMGRAPAGVSVSVGWCGAAGSNGVKVEAVSMPVRQRSSSRYIHWRMTNQGIIRRNSNNERRSDDFRLLRGMSKQILLSC
ncbi:hypothetical protein Syun_004649 [Stephania yunnanensis]|uniref:Uncharacterized protein n=1 Tax=Stephania yunnanensis TaxID=152371 RepID=A0AAP0Q117_9MAGN